jgi:hypothetical protein
MLRGLSGLFAVVADGFYWALGHGLSTRSFFFFVFGLLVDKVVVARLGLFEVLRSKLRTQTAQNALLVRVPLALNVCFPLI